MMITLTEAPAQIHDLIKERWSPLAYSERPVRREELIESEHMRGKIVLNTIA